MYCTSRTTRLPHYTYHTDETPAGGRSKPGKEASHWRRACLSPPSRGVHCRPSARQHLATATTPRPNPSPQPLTPTPHPNFPPCPPILPAPAQVHYGTPAKLKSKGAAAPALTKMESTVVPHDASEDVHVPGEHEGQPDGWNVRAESP